MTNLTLADIEKVFADLKVAREADAEFERRYGVGAKLYVNPEDWRKITGASINPLFLDDCARPPWLMLNMCIPRGEAYVLRLPS